MAAENEKVDLDDFFAKRDKKKKSGKKKYETTEELAKILGKRTEERKKLEEGKSQYVVQGEGVVPNTQNEDDEWLEQKEETVDLTGLKVTELVLLDDEEEEIAEGKDPGEVGGMTDGPWRKREKAAGLPPPVPVPTASEKSSSTTTPTNEEEDKLINNKDHDETAIITEKDDKSVDDQRVTPTPVEVAEDKPSGPAKYVPPAVKKAMEAAAAAATKSGGGGAGTPAPPVRDIFEARPLSETSGGSGASAVDGGVKGAYVPPWKRAGASSVPGSASGKPRKTAAAPNIHDEEYFPSLGAS